MDHYRVNKLSGPGGRIVKTKDVIAATAKQAVQDARNDADCPVCEVWHAGTKIGSIT